jgi:hypothetical protein
MKKFLRAVRLFLVALLVVPFALVFAACTPTKAKPAEKSSQHEINFGHVFVDADQDGDCDTCGCGL